MNLDKERERLSQAANLAWLQRDWKATDMVPVLQKPRENSQGGWIYSTLIPADKIQLPLAPPGEYWPPDAPVFPVWDEEGRDISGINRDLEGNAYFVIACRFGEREWLEIDQEFRFFHNLFHNTETNEYLKQDWVDDNQEKVVVAVVDPNGVKIRFKELCDFLKSKEMYLELHFRCSAYSEHSLAELGLYQNETDLNRPKLPDGYLSWKYYCFAARREGYQSESALHAKRLIGFSKVEQQKSVEFIIGVDENGHEIRHTSNLRSAMYTNIGWSPNPIVVHFEKEVLDEYYRKANTYTITDMLLSCHPNNGEVVWNLPIDDNHDDRVCVLLTSLCFLPYEELLHWRRHNIPPEGDLSDTYHKRFAQRIPVESKQLGHWFRHRYNELQAVCHRYLDWQLVRPFGNVRSANRSIVPGTPLIIRYSGPDEHHLRCLRVPFSDNQSDFDEMVRSLVLVLIDSLDVGNLKGLFPPNQQNKFRDEHTIAWLEATLNHFGVEGAGNHICFLKQLQNLRSSGVAHRKDSDPPMYADSVEYFNLAKLGLQKGFAEILRRAIEVLEFFVHIAQRGELRSRKEVSLLYDLNERLGALFETLFPSESEGVFTDETWMRETVPGIEQLANHLMTKVVPKFDGSATELMNICEPPITSLKPDATTADIRSAITYIAKVFIRAAPDRLQHAMHILFLSEQTSMPTTEVFEETASRVTYSKKLVDFSLGFVNHDEVADSAWYRHYVAHLLSYVSCYTAYTYTHVLRADGLDSTSVILDLVSIVQSATDVAEKIASDDARNHLQEVKKAAKDLAQAVSPN